MRIDIDSQERAIALITNEVKVRRNAVSFDGVTSWQFWAESDIVDPPNLQLSISAIERVKEVISWLKTGEYKGLVTAGEVEIAIILQETKDAAYCAALMSMGYLASVGAKDGKPCITFTKGAKAVISDLDKESPFAYAVQAANNWLAHTYADPEKANDFRLMLKGNGMKRAIVSRELVNDTSKYRDIRLPSGKMQRVRNTFRDTLRGHLYGV